ncbi:hypothetical protein FRC06_008815 [Ceratobasidium sp. 370]|nr:hypothetical protein FRC06_008815 [Ceratobasidium sp. 370]
MSDDELTRFREQWKEEVRARTAGESSSTPSAPSTSQPPARARRSPVEIYAEAVEKERRGELDVALDLYRRAFRLDPHVDRTYHLHTTTAALTNLTLAPITPKAGDSEPHTRIRINVSATSAHSIRTLVANFPPASELAFAPEIEQEPVHLARIPDELLLHILKLTDIPSIEKFALVCRRARLLTLDPDLWRDFVTSTYVHPQIPADALLGDIVSRFAGDLRRLYIEFPRVRLDGVYIAVCHYVCVPSPSLDVMTHSPPAAQVKVDHLVTYHRYLRFLPDGRVLSLLDQNLAPQEAVKILEPSLRLKGFFIGTWLLNASDDNDTSKSGSGSDSAPHITLNNLTDPTGVFGHSFKMELTLSSRPLGRWNRLTLDSYTSLDSEGTPSELPIRNERPFWFSKVRSWA